MTRLNDVEGAAELVASIWGEGDYELRPLSGGANNQVYELSGAGVQAVLKVYFHHPDDGRDRQGTEAAFLRFAAEHGLAQVPALLGSDAPHHLNLLELIEGSPFGSRRIDGDAVGRAADFFRSVNAHRASPSASGLPVASEAGFSIHDHLERAASRIERLRTLGLPAGDRPSGEMGEAVARFVERELVPTSERLAAWVLHWSGRQAIDPVEPLDAGSRCISLADFGFHNSIVAADGSLRFVDFEYAGWDDPAKAVSDFFWQPKLQVPRDFLADFVAVALDGLDATARDAARFSLVDPVCGLRWACICLNEFLDTDRQRRTFAASSTDADRQASQLEKSRRYVEAVGTVCATDPVLPW